jgi:hypothetical protein
MRIYLDTDSRRLLTTPTRPLSLLEFKRRDNDSIELQFLRDAVVQELPEGTTARVGIKPEGEYEADFLAVSSLTQTGTGTATVYSGELNLNTTAVAAAFAAEPDKVSAMIEVEWVTGDVVSSSKTIPTTLHNDVIRGDEGTPTAMPSLKATLAEAEAGTSNEKWMTPLRTAQAIEALGGGVSSWNDLTDKPSLFPAEYHSHALGDLIESGAAPGQVPVWDGTAWTPQTPTIPSVETKAYPSISANSLTLDLSAATFFVLNLTEPITSLVFSDPPAEPGVFSFTLQFIADGTSREVTWPTSLKWAGGSSPTITATSEKIDIYSFVTHDGGVNWYGFVIGQNF